MNIDVYHDRIVVKKIDLEAKTSGGIILGEVEKDRETVYGFVLKVGEGKHIDGTGKIPVKTVEGDIIAFTDNIGIKRFTYLGKHFYHLRESEVIFRIGEEDKSLFNVKEYQTEGYEFDKGVTRILK